MVRLAVLLATRCRTPSSWAAAIAFIEAIVITTLIWRLAIYFAGW